MCFEGMYFWYHNHFLFGGVARNTLYCIIHTQVLPKSARSPISTPIESECPIVSLVNILYRVRVGEDLQKSFSRFP
jgi:hypothetical protein